MTGDKIKGKRPNAQSDFHKPVSRAQRQVLWESHMFELELPQEIQNWIVATLKSLWEEIDNQKLEQWKKVEEWI